MILRPRQEVFIKNSVQALKKHGNTLGVAVTGFGKTVCLSAIIKKMTTNGNRSLVVAHRDELTRQNSETFQAVCPDIPISFFNAKRKSWRGQTIFSMVQTLSQSRHLENMPPVDFLVYDEAHHAASDSYRKLTARVKELNSGVKILGVTATPERSDTRGLKDTFTNVADIVGISEMVRAGHLVPPRGMVIDIGTQEQLRDVKRTANDYNMAEVEAIQNTTVLNNKIVEKWEELALDRPSVAFCATIQHAEDVRNAFRDAGFLAESVHSEVPAKQRKAILEDFDRGNIQVLTNPMILTEGWDCQICSCIMLLRSSSYKSTMIQMVGRGLRKVDPRRYPGVIKKDCIILDFGISLLNHGDLETNADLEEDREAGESVAKVCPQCEAEIPIQAGMCPLCGFEFIGQETEDETPSLESFELTEIQLINKSPFKWTSIFPSEKVLVASGFNAWSAVVSPDGDNWFAIGGGQGRQVEVLTIANKPGAIGSADDYMRLNETARTAKKAARWMRDYASMKQIQHLGKMGYQTQDVVWSKGEAAAHLTFQFNRNTIERLIGVS